MSYRAVRPDESEWITRPHERGEPARHVAELSERLRVSHVRGWMCPAGGVINVPAGTPLQSVNHGDVDLVVHAYGYPPEETKAGLLDSAV